MRHGREVSWLYDPRRPAEDLVEPEIYPGDKGDRQSRREYSDRRVGAHPNGMADAGCRQCGLRIGAPWQRELETVVSRLYLLLASPKPSIVVFLTPESGSSGLKSVCACSSEVLASQTSGQVCLVEANPNVISMQHAIALCSGGSFSDLLVNPDLDVRTTAVQLPGRNLWLLSGGLPLRNGASLSECDHLIHRMRDLRMKFDFVLIDAPPPSTSRDALVLSHAADGALLVLPASGAPRGWTCRLRRELDIAGVRLLGAILIDHSY